MSDISTPVTLEHLDDDHAIFVGSGEVTHTGHTMFGKEIEMHARYPRVILTRDVWEGLGRPTEFECGLTIKPTLPTHIVPMPELETEPT